MAIVFNGLFGSNQDKTAGTVLSVTGSATLATGDDIFVAFASDDGGSAHGITDTGTAAITWTLEKEQINTGNVKTQLWRGVCTSGGTLTNVQISWTTNVTAKAMVVGWFSGVGTQDANYGANGAGSTNFATTAGTWETNDLVVYAGGWERPSTDDLVPAISDAGEAEVGQDGTTGQGATSNITTVLCYQIAPASHSADGSIGSQNNTSTGDWAGAGAVYSPFAPAVPSIITPRYKQPHRFLVRR